MYVAKSCAFLASIPPHSTLMYLRSLSASAREGLLVGVFAAAAAAAFLVGVLVAAFLAGAFLATLASLTGEDFLGPMVWSRKMGMDSCKVGDWRAGC